MQRDRDAGLPAGDRVLLGRRLDDRGLERGGAEGDRVDGHVAGGGHPQGGVQIAAGGRAVGQEDHLAVAGGRQAGEGQLEGGAEVRAGGGGGDRVEQLEGLVQVLGDVQAGRRDHDPPRRLAPLGPGLPEPPGRVVPARRIQGGRAVDREDD